MIVRVFRARVRPGKKAEFEQTVRQHSIPLVEAQKGLITYYVGRPVDSNDDEFIMVTVWPDLDTLKKFTGPDWNRSIIPEQEQPLLIESSVEHYEVFGSS